MLLVTNPAHLSWWWQYGLDGVVGGVIGGGVTGWAVWATIRHERRMAEETDVRRAARQLQATALSVILFPSTSNQEEWERWRDRMFHDAVFLREAAESRAPGLSRDAQSLLEQLDAVVNDERIDTTAAAATGAAVNVRVSTWQRAPKAYEKLAPVSWGTEVADAIEERLAAKADEAAEKEVTPPTPR